MDLQKMTEACGYLKGTHDFRNFCKLNVLSTTNYVREIMDAYIEKDPNQNFDIFEKNNSNKIKNPFELYYLVVRGNAFLWHQIRCIVQVLFSIGNGFDEPNIIKDLLDIEKFPAKPG